MSDTTPERATRAVPAPDDGSPRGGSGRRGRSRRGRRSRGGGAGGSGATGGPPPRARAASGSGTRTATARAAGTGTRARAGGGDRSRRDARAARDAARVDAARAAATLRVLEAHGAADRENRARVRANRRRVVALCAAAAFLPALAAGVVVGALLGPAVGAGAAVAAGVVVGVLAARTALPVALRVVGGRPVGDDDQPALANLVEGICATMGVARPELRLVDDPVVNSCSLAGRHGRAVVVVTTGLLERLGLIEMEGVVAHELAHVKRLDARVAAVAVATAGTVARLTGDDRPVHLAVGRGREYDADRVAVLAVRYPPGLHDALVRCRSGPGARDGSVFAGRRWAATRWLWIDPMVGAPDRMPLGELDATDVRAAALAEW